VRGVPCVRASRACPGASEIPPGRRAGYGAKRGKKRNLLLRESSEGERERERARRVDGERGGERQRTGCARRPRGSAMRRDSRPFGITARRGAL